MTTKKTKAVETKATEPEWTTVANKAQNDVPFGSMSNIHKAIQQFRTVINSSPLPRNGVAQTPGIKEYRYCLSEDVVSIADKFLQSEKLFLDTGSHIADTGETVVTMTIYDYERGEGEPTKMVSISIGKPASTAELGARITYVQKYLVALLFGVSIATDTDAFNNGVIQEKHGNNKQTNLLGNVLGGSSIPVGGTDSPVGVIIPSNSNEDNNSGNNTRADRPVVQQVQQLEHTKSYPLAKEFIVKSLSQAMLDSAVTKVTNSMTMREDEKAELTALIEQRRKEVGE